MVVVPKNVIHGMNDVTVEVPSLVFLAMCTPSLESSQTQQHNGLFVHYIANQRYQWAKRQTKHIDSIDQTL